MELTVKNMKKNPLRIVAVSDTHGEEKIMSKLLKLQGDLFIHAGDFTYYGKFFDFLQKLNFKHKIVIAGNHQIMLDDSTMDSTIKKQFLDQYHCSKNRNQLIAQLKKRCHYLQHQLIEIQGLRIFASPYTPFWGGSAFQYEPQYDQQIWSAVPENIDILVTHGPPHGFRDSPEKGVHAGSVALRQISKLRSPKYHIFGHIHQAKGIQTIGNTTYANVAFSPLQFNI